MKTTGIFRKIDELGRIVVPKEIRTAIGFVEGTILEVAIEDSNILIYKGDGSNAQVRKVDCLGRVVIPMSIRKGLNLNEKDSLEIFVENKGLILKKYNVNCIMCGSFDNLVDVKEKIICNACVHDIKRMNI